MPLACCGGSRDGKIHREIFSRSKPDSNSRVPVKNLNHGASRATSRGHSSGHRNTRDKGVGQQRGSQGGKIERKRKRDATNTAGPVEGGDLNTRYEIEPMGRVRRMQISLIIHTGYFAVIIAVHARGCISYDGEFRGYPSSPEKFTVKYCPLNPEPAGRSYFCNTSTVEPAVHPRRRVPRRFIAIQIVAGTLS